MLITKTLSGNSTYLDMSVCDANVETFFSPSESLVKVRKLSRRKKTSFVIIFYQHIEKQIFMDQGTHIYVNDIVKII